MKKIIFTFITLIIFSVIKSQSFNWKLHQVKNDSDLLKTTTWIYASSPTNGEFGTGYFFYSKKRNELYIVTNRHVIEGHKSLAFGYHSTIRSDSLFGIDSLQYRVKFFRDKFLDLAAIRIDNISYFNLKNFNYYKIFTEDNFLTKTDSSAISIFENKIVALSFPGITSIPLPYQPYIINCSLSIPYDMAWQNSLSDLIIEGNLTQGCSGSPIVFMHNKQGKKRYCLLGTFYFSFSNYQSIDSVNNYKNKRYSFEMSIDTAFINNNETYSLQGYKIGKQLNIGKAVKSNYLIDLINGFRQ